MQENKSLCILHILDIIENKLQARRVLGLSQKIFKKETYSRKNNVKSIFCVIRIKFGDIKKNKSTMTRNKETRLNPRTLRA